jgi:DNA ligase (NAD+)
MVAAIGLLPGARGRQHARQLPAPAPDRPRRPHVRPADPAVSTLGGIALFGAVGFIVGPIVAALFVTVWHIYGETFRAWLPPVPERLGGVEIAGARVSRKPGGEAAPEASSPMIRRMTAPAAAERIEELREEIRRHDHLYYVEDRSGAVRRRLRRPLPRAGAARRATTPSWSPRTRRRSGWPARRSTPSPPSRTRRRCCRSTPTRTPRPSRASTSGCARRSAALLEEIAYVVEPKLDGLSIELVYEDGAPGARGDARRRPARRGITPNVQTIRSVPLRLRGPGLARAAAVRRDPRRGADPPAGLRKVNEALLADGKEPFANARNAAAGSLRQLDPRIAASRRFVLEAYDVLAADWAGGEAPFATHWELLETLAAWGLRSTRRAGG